MTQRRKMSVFFSLFLIMLMGSTGYSWFSQKRDALAQGIVIEALDNIPVYNNGLIYTTSHGRHYAPSGYYYGQKWQCVEFIKRYLYEVKRHKMPDVWGNAISFFDPDISHGSLNPKRGMTQYQQGGSEKPQKGDLVVFSGAGGYGHVAIVANVSETFVEIVQQNSPPSRQKLPLAFKDGGFKIGQRSALGWLRIP